MKKIVVLTDFSPRSINAGRYAFSLASQLKAHVWLYHHYQLPEAIFQEAEKDQLQVQYETQLMLQAKALQNEGNDLSSDFIPAIFSGAVGTTDSMTLDSLLEDKEVVLLVMGNHHSGFSGLLRGNHTKKVLFYSTVPVLVIPENCTFNPLKKITFATDLHHSDLEVTNSVAGLARPFNAQILLAHICQDKVKASGPVNEFLHQVTNHINYPSIYYREVCQDQLIDGFNQLIAHVGTDLLVMVHRNKGFMEQLFHTSYTQKVAAYTHLPLLVYPYPAKQLPVFSC